MRAKYSVPTNEVLQSHIEVNNKLSSKERLERYKYVWREFGPPVDMLLGGGIQSFLAFEEIKLCYIEGFYLATVLLAQIFIENSLGAEYIIAGADKTVESGFYQIINKSLEDNRINKRLANKFHKLRRIRNTYIHPKGGTGPGTIIERIFEKIKRGKSFTSIYKMAKEDSKEAISIVADYLFYTSKYSHTFTKTFPKEN